MTDYVLNRQEGEIALGIYGEIGKDIDGHVFARLLTEQLQQADYHTVHIRINSQGGNVIHGMSIFTALYNIRNKVQVHIDGVALSMAGIIAMAGRKVVMNDFGRLMIHNPFIKGKEAITEKEERMLNQMRTMLSDIMVNMRGLDRGKLDSLMSAETWFTAAEALGAKMIDEVINTGMRAAVSAGASAGELVAIMNTCINNLNKKPMDLKKLLAALHLGDDAGEDKVLESLTAKDTRIAELSAEVAALQAKLKAPDDYIAGDISKKLGFNGPVTIDKAMDAIEALSAKATFAGEVERQYNSLRAELINEILSQAVADRKFPATQKSYYRTLLEKEFETGKRIIAGLNPVQRIADFVRSDFAGQDRSKWTWNDYQEKDPNALLRMENDAPEMFAQLYLEHYKKPYQG